MQSLPGSRCSTAAKISVEVILEKIYPRSCRLETAIERLLPSCDLYEDSDPAAYIKLCSNALLACKNGGLQVLFESQISPSQALSAISVLPGYSSTLDWNDQAPIQSVLGAVPTEKFTVDLRLARKRPPFYEFLADIGFEILNERIGSGLLLRLLTYCSIFIPLENDCYLQITGAPVYSLFTANVIPIRRRPWSLDRRLRHVNRMKRRDRLCHKKRKDRRERRRRRRRKRQIERSQDDGPPSKRVRLEVPPTDNLSEDQPSATAAALTEGEGMETERPSDPDRTTTGNHHTNREVSNKTNAVCKSTGGDRKSSDSDSNSDTALVHLHPRPSHNFGSRLLGHRKRRVVACVPYSLMSSAKKQAQREKDRERKKKMIRKLEQKLKNSHVLSHQKRKRIKRHLKRLRQHRRGKLKKKQKATNAEADKKPGSQNSHRKKLLINRRFMFYSATKQKFSSIYALQQLQPSVNGARKLVAHIFEGRPIQDEPRSGPLLDSGAPSSVSVGLPPLQDNPKQKTFRLSKRLQQVVPHFQQLLYNHKVKINYGGLLNHYCPLSSHLLSLATTAPPTANDQSRPELSEGPLPKKKAATAPGRAAGGGTSVSEAAAAGTEGENHHGQSTQATHKEPPLSLKEIIAQLVSQGKLTYNQVCAFVKAVLRHLVPMAIWGSAQNRKLFFKHVEKFVSLGKFETITVQDLMHGYKLSSCEWLKLPSPIGRGKPHPPSYPLARKLLHWLMDEVVVRTIKAYFYVTEHSSRRNQIFYYRKELWACVEKLAIKERTNSLLSQISLREMRWMCHEGKSLGVSKLRFLPKLTGVRPIINLQSRTTSSNEKASSVNFQLNAAFHILNMEMKRRPELVGSSCFGKNEVYQKLKKFATQQASVNPQQEGPLFFVHTDIATCYDSILPDKLFEIIVTKVLSQESYLLRRYSKIYLTPRGVKRRFIKTAITRAENKEPFYEFAFNSSVQDANCILIDQIMYPVVKRDALKDLLKKHLFGNLVKLGFKYFRQTEGIPQGSKISSMLCGFYYADMERKCLPRVDPRKGLLLRFVDDFLLITREPEVAKEFLTTLERGVPEYNCRINTGKTSTNFDILPDGSPRVNKREWIEWCGFLVNTSTLDVKINLSRYTSTEMKSCVTLRIRGNPVLSLRRFIKQAAILRCLPLFLDGQLQSKKIVASNVYESFIVVAMKFIVFVRSVPEWYPTKGGMEKRAKRKQSIMFFRLIMDSIYSFVKQAVDICSKAGGVFPVPRVVCWWLCCSAYKRVLERHEPARMSMLIRLLASRMTAATNAMSVQWVKLSHRTIVRAGAVDEISL